MTALISETEFDIDAVLDGLLRANSAYTLVLSTPELIVTDVNARLCLALQTSAEALRGKRLTELSENLPQKLVDYATREIRQPTQAPLRACLTTQCGQIPVEVSASPLPSANRLILYCVDLRASNETNTSPGSSKPGFQSVFEKTPTGILLLNRKLEIFQANPRAAALLGYSRDDLADTALADLLDAEDYRSIAAELADPKQKGRCRRETQIRHKGGEEIWASLEVLPLNEDAEEPACFLAQFEDITERRQHEAKLEQLAYYDPLTGLANRRQLIDRIELALGRARRHNSLSALLYLDLDSFKRVNDELGHAAGDLLLRAVSDRLDECTRNTDLVARPGGDEFAILLEDIHQPEDAERLAAKLIEALRVPLSIHGQNRVITCSVGITLMPQDGTCVHSIMQNADAAMYEAKRQGRNGYRFFGARMNSKAMRRQAIEHELHAALNDKTLQVHLQPQVDVADGKLIGAEALCRWQHPTLGPIEPAEFIHVAEETGMIVELGEWVIEQACKASVALTEQAGRTIRVSANVSAAQLRDTKFAEKVKRLIDAYQISERQLELELTESILIENAEGALTLLNSLRELGVSLSIDDFGTGYSSLEYLKQLPLSTLKIDRAFIDAIPDSREDKAIASGLIVMAHRMQMTVVAEGVETQAQLDFLRGQGCDLVQGYYLGKPVPLEELQVA